MKETYFVFSPTKLSWNCTQMTSVLCPEILLAQKLILWLGQRFSICKFSFFYVAVVIAFYKLHFGIIIEGLKNVEKVVDYKYHYCIEAVVQTSELKWVFFFFPRSQMSKFLRHCCIVHNIHGRVTTSRRWTRCLYLWKHSSAIDFMRTEALGLKVFVRSCNQPRPKLNPAYLDSVIPMGHIKSESDPHTKAGLCIPNPIEARDRVTVCDQLQMRTK